MFWHTLAVWIPRSFLVGCKIKATRFTRFVVGQPCDHEAIMEKARNGGAFPLELLTPGRRCVATSAFPVLAWQAKYEQIYLLGHRSRPLISKVCLQVAKEVGATAYAHGATGKGKRRFQLAAEALDPKIEIIAMARSKNSGSIPGRTGAH